MNDRFRISRRTVLRGLGTAVALPVLEAMLPTHSFATPNAQPSGATPPLRMAFLCVPNGKHMPDWTPKGEGADFEIGPILDPVSRYRSKMLILSGLTLNGGRALGDGPGDHARSCASFLTSAHPKKTHGADISNGISIDQALAQSIGDRTRFASLELGTEPSAQSGNCDSGYSCAYSSNISWRTPTTPVAKEINPSSVFDRLFGTGTPSEQDEAKVRRTRLRKSVLDFVRDDANQLHRRLGIQDQRKLDEYLHAVRDVERRLIGVAREDGQPANPGDYPRPAGMQTVFADHVRIMFDLMALAFQTDSTRVISFMYLNEGNNRSYKEIDVAEGHHDLSHHGNDAAKQSKISKINHFHVSLLAHLLDRLDNISDAHGCLLDQSMIVYGSGIGDGNRHNHDDLPIAVFGKAGGRIATGRHELYAKETPLANLYRSMLDLAGSPTREFGDATGPLERLHG
ncbi:MAG: DUF1552 domain-containing protein [Planctomycetes bacterium]|nr:DUF1552 domain-containing protein [Planctomycetota bacterium]